MKTERRAIQHEFEVRANNNGTTTIEGYAAVFNRDSQPLGWDGFIERVAPGAFKKTIKEADVRALFNHDPSFVLGRNKAETLRLSEDSSGLNYQIDVDLENTDARNVVRMIERGDVSQSSFGFSTVKDEWSYSEDENEPVVRTLKEVRLFDVSPVTYPAYLDTEVDVKRALRSLSQATDKPIEDLENHARKGDLKTFITGESQEPEESRDEHSDSTSSIVIARRRLELEALRRPA